LAALYRAARVGGDFFDFLQVGGSKLLFVMLDIAGKREAALHIAAAAQDLFSHGGNEIFASDDVEDSQAITRLLLDMNRAMIAAAGGVCCAPAFLGCYDETISTLTYINAGHTPAVLKDEEGTLLLEANGLPLGLFSRGYVAKDQNELVEFDLAILRLCYVQRGPADAEPEFRLIDVERDFMLVVA